MIPVAISKPSIAIPENQKDIDYHRRWAYSIVSNSLTEVWANSYLLMSELYRFYNSGSNPGPVSFLTHSADGQDLPAYWTTTNTVRTKVDLLV